MIARDGVERWHAVVRNMTSEALDELLAEDVVFHSPVVHTPQRGRDVTKLYLMAAFNVLPGSGGPTASADEAGAATGKFEYVREVVGERDAVLEFRTEIDGIVVNGVDLIRWNDAGEIVDFKVMVRPRKAMEKLHAQMAAMLESMQRGGHRDAKPR